MSTGVRGVLFNVQRFSIHDGPGIRTTVFLKGCPLRCFWCHNPEGLWRKPEVQYFPARCIGCGECTRLCPRGAQELQDGVHIYHRERCATCGECVEGCFAEGLKLNGYEVTAGQVVAEVLRDRPFYETSAGGVTLSGGEPLLQPEFARAILAGCKAEGLHTAVETSAYCAWEALEAILPLTDLFLVDLKHLDPQKHRAGTGVSNDRILENALRLARRDRPISFRVPVVRGFNDTPMEMAAIAGFVASLNGTAGKIFLELLPFHRLAAEKYRSLGLDYRAADLEMPGPEKMEELAAIVERELKSAQLAG